MKKRLLFICLILLVGSIFGRPKLDEFRGNYRVEPVRADSLHGFDVISYDIELGIDDDENYISGLVTAVVIAEEDLTSIEYELESLTVLTVTVDGQNASYTHDNGIINIVLDVENGQQFVTEVSYSGNPVLSPDGYNIGMVFRSNMVFTISDPNAGRYWWPSYDHPWDKALVDFTIRCRSDWVAACNGIQGETIDNGDGTKTYNWVGSNPMSTYLAVIHLAPYLVIEQVYTNSLGEDIPIQHFVQSNYYDDCIVDFEKVPEMMEVYANLYGEYAFEKYGQALVNMQTYGAMEHQTMTTLGIGYIDGLPHDAEYTVAHELAHHWYGDCLTPLTWKDVWLSEGFAVYSEAVWAEHLYGYEGMLDFVHSRIQDDYKSWQNSNGPQTIYDPAYLAYFASPSYEKAASVLHMLRLEVGDADFWEILATWFEDYKYQNIITSEFIEQCEGVSGLDLEQFFEQWIFSSGIPSIEYAVFKNSSTNEVKFYNNVTSDSDTEFFLTVPFYEEGVVDSLKVQFSPGYNMSTAVEVSDITNEITVDPQEWNLLEGSTDFSFQVENIFAGDETVYLSWEAFINEDDFNGYNVYMKSVSATEWFLANSQPVIGNEYQVDNLENGESYHFYVTIVADGGFESAPTNSSDIHVTPNAIIGSETILIIDDTVDGTGGLLSPLDADVDAFYMENIFGGYDVDMFDIHGTEELTVALLLQYNAVVWSNESFSNSLIMNHTDLLGNYLLAGGKLLVSGWKITQHFPAGFIETFLSVDDYHVVSTPEFSTATSSIYNNLNVNSDISPSIWNGNLSMITTYPNAENVLYYNMFAGDSEPSPIAIFNSNENWEIFLFGFPLYYMQPQEVRSMMLSLFSSTSPPVSNDNSVEEVALVVGVYPNPVQDKLNLKIAGSRSGTFDASVYNIKGQKVREYSGLEVKSGKTVIELSSDSGSLSNGIYFVRVTVDNKNVVRKVMILK